MAANRDSALLEEERIQPEEQEAVVEKEEGFFSANMLRIGLVALVVVLVAGFFVGKHYAGRESTDDAQIEANIIPVSAKVGGTVAEVKVRDNDYVEAGTVLAVIDTRDYEVALKRSAAELADAQANAQAARTGVPIMSTSTSSTLATAQANVSVAQEEVATARAKQQEAEANYSKASADLARMKQLVDKDEISRQQYDASVAAEASARASLDSARAAVSTAMSRVAQAKAQLASAATAPQQVSVTQSKASAANALVQQKQAAVEQSQLNLQYTTIKAPSNGIVRKSLQVGQIIAPGQPLFALVAVDEVWVIANYKETQLKAMRVGQTAKVHVDAYDRDFEGQVDSVGGATAAKFSLLPPENATGNYVKVVQRIPVKIVFKKDQDPQHLLRPGMSVVPTVFTK